MKNIGTVTVNLPSDREIALTRTFAAPRQMLYLAFSDPEILKRWFGPRDWTLVMCKIDARVGGSFRFTLRAPDGQELGMHGTYRELSPPERSVHTEEFGDFRRVRPRSAVSQLPTRVPCFFAPFTRRMPAARSGLSNLASAAS